MKGKIEHIEEDGLTYEVRTYSNGTKYWLYKGQYHRLNGPAVEYSNFTKNYYINGELHRLDGPAMEWADGTKAYYIKGKYFDIFEDYKEAVVQIKIKEILNGP